MSHDAAHGHGDHDHPDFLAHHFDDPEQQYDSGKLGMWLFLVTEILFFSGMFCAYALFRAKNPEVWTFASQFLNETLGAFNTGVLLFSSLTMAWGVRCAQMNKNRGLVVCLAMTLGCASIFLGVKAIEYTHKWDLGLLPAGMYQAQYLQAEAHTGVSSWLYTLSIVPAICLVGFLLWYVVALVRGQSQQVRIAGPLLVTAVCYFLGVGIGIFFESAEAAEHGSEHSAVHSTEHTGSAGEVHHDESHGEEGSASGSANTEHGEGTSDAEQGGEGTSDENSTETTDASQLQPAGRLVALDVPDEMIVPGAPLTEEIDQQGGAGLFFSIYYCMTGVHAIHILAGMAVLTWLLVRATRDEFSEQYFGPVDYVGLYWHIVDLIWIYLFPLLYLIT